MKDPIIILGPGRCGSTLIQRILNVSEQVTIWGEHAGFLKGVAESYYQLTASQDIERNFYSQEIDASLLVGSLKEYKACPNWVNSFNRSSIHETYKNFIYGLLNNNLLNIDKCFWGFKEIRYTKEDRVLDMWLDLFPDSRIIFSIRNPYDVVRSMIQDWCDQSKVKYLVESNSIEQIRKLAIGYATRWNNVVISFKYWIENKQDTCFYVKRYEDLLEDPEAKIKEIFAFLDIPMPENIGHIMNMKVGSKRLSYASDLSRIVKFDLREDIWQIVSDTAEYFGYKSL